MLRKLALLCALLLPAQFLWAQNVPDSLRGIWASPNCEAPTQTLAIFKGFYLWIGEQETVLTGLSSSSTTQDGWTKLIESGGYPNYVQITADGKLREAYRPDNAPENASPDANWSTQDYLSCANRLPRANVLLHGEPMAMLKAIDNVYGTCETDRQGCATTLFAAVDVSGDGKLSTAELARLIRIGTYLAAVSSDDSLENTELAGTITATIGLAPILASAVIHSFDYNNDGGVSLIELSQDRGTLIDGIQADSGSQLGQRLQQMKEAIKPLGQLLEGMGR